MSYLLEDLIIDRVDLVDEGANSASFIALYKRKERGNMNLEEILASLEPEQAKVVQDAIDTASGNLSKALADVAAIQKEKDDLVASFEKEKEDLKKSKDGDSEEALLKAMPEAAKTAYLQMKAQKEAAEQEVRKARDAEAHAEAVNKALSLKALPIEQEKLVSILKTGSDEFVEVLTKINKAIADSVLGEVGSVDKNNSTSEAAWAKIEGKAAEIVKVKGVTKAKAITMVVNDNPELYKEYIKGGAN